MTMTLAPRPCDSAAISIAVRAQPKNMNGREEVHDREEAPRRVQVLLVDDHPIIRLGIGYWIGDYPDLRLIGGAESGEQALELASHVHPDVISLDLTLPGISGLETLRALREQVPEAKIVVLTATDRGDVVRDALQAGAIGYHLKGTPMEPLAEAIRSAMRNEATLDANAARELAQAAARSLFPFEPLTERERDVLRLLVQGLSNVKIATELVVTVATIKYHVRSIRRKLQADNRTHIVSLALHHHLFDDE